MAVTPTPRPTPNKRPPADPATGVGLNLPNPALAALEQFSPLLPLGVAFSGGADSTALLYATAARWPGQVTAIHVHHGLQAAADGFVRICEEACKGLGLPLHVVHVSAGHAAGQSPEDAARLARYAALAEAATSMGLQAVLLGQHADDQVETLLLALSRGAGLPGLSAMAAGFERGGMVFHRPLLQVPAADLRQWLVQSGVPFVDDPTNTDERFTRNRIRARLMPALQDSFPQFRETFARSARHAAQAQALLVELATEDLARVGMPPVIKVLQGLSRARQGNLLRQWLVVAHQAAPSTAQLEQLLGQIEACTTRGHRIELKVADGQVRREGDVLTYAA
ncbi:tRNA lysidine(34) synthetase TilS [Polaromonas sp.]|uniref:tRNA lysidine(34) synthetase TilS n=1 Tax=Polaromonas sp. TaxID=1869339 RepID=UPI0037505022